MRIKLTTSLEEGYNEKLEDIAKVKNLRSRGALDKGKAIMYLVDQWEESRNGMDKKRK